MIDTAAGRVGSNGRWRRAVASVPLRSRGSRSRGRGVALRQRRSRAVPARGRLLRLGRSPLLPLGAYPGNRPLRIQRLLLVDAAGLSLFLAPLAFPECLFACNSISRVAGFNFLETLLVLRLTSLLVGSGGNEGGRSHLGSTWRGLLKRRGEHIDDRQTEETGDADTLHPRPESRFAA